MIGDDARQYDPTTGRWLSPDPIGFAAGDANLYRYVGNGPSNFTDPSGLATATARADSPGVGSTSLAGSTTALTPRDPGPIRKLGDIDPGEFQWRNLNYTRGDEDNFEGAIQVDNPLETLLLPPEISGFLQMLRWPGLANKDRPSSPGQAKAAPDPAEAKAREEMEARRRAAYEKTKERIDQWAWDDPNPNLGYNVRIDKMNELLAKQAKNPRDFSRKDQTDLEELKKWYQGVQAFLTALGWRNDYRGPNHESS